MEIPLLGRFIHCRVLTHSKCLTRRKCSVNICWMPEILKNGLEMVGSFDVLQEELEILKSTAQKLEQEAKAQKDGWETELLQ